MLIYKLFRGEEWDDMMATGETDGAPIDVADGYIHFSTAAQVKKTAEIYFAGVEELWLLAVEADHLGDALKWEPSRGGDLFPHLYRRLRHADCTAAHELPLVDGVHVFPELGER